MSVAVARFDRASQSLVRSFEGGTEDAGAAIVDQAQAELTLKANAAVLRTAMGMSKSLLDILA